MCRIVRHYVGVFVFAPRAPRRPEEVDALDVGHFVVKHVRRIGQAPLREVARQHVGREGAGAKFVIAADDNNVLEAWALASKPVVEVRELGVCSVVREIARVDKDVGGGQVLFLQRAMQHVRVTDVQQCHGPIYTGPGGRSALRRWAAAAAAAARLST